MSLADIVNNFNITVDIFIKYLRTIEDNDDIAYYHGLFNKLIQVDSTKIIEQFVINGIPYSDEIENHDENFFLKIDYENKHNDQNISLTKILNWKEVFKILDVKKKETIFEYFQAFLFYAKQYFCLKYSNVVK